LNENFGDLKNTKIYILKFTNNHNALNSSNLRSFFLFKKLTLKYYARILFLIIFGKELTYLGMKDKTIDYILRATWQTVSRMYNEEAQNYGATMATGFALLSMDKDKGTPSTSLGPKMGMEATSLTRTLKSMEEKGLIIRKKNPDDGRGVLIYLTDFGREKRELSKNTVLKFNETVKQHISEEKFQHFIEVAETINELILEKNIFNSKENLVSQKK
jgi:DNA-binding MarR family transcriptional regulator